MSSGVQAWFRKHGSSIRYLNIQINAAELIFTLAKLKEIIVSMLRATHENLEHLLLAISGAPLLAAQIWRQLSQTDGTQESPPWPNLTSLQIEVEGSSVEGASEAAASTAALAVLCTLPSIPSLKKVNISLIDVKLHIIPRVLRNAVYLEELSLEITSNNNNNDQLKQTSIQLPMKRSAALPLPPNLKTLRLANLPFYYDHIVTLVPKVCRNLECFQLF